MLGVAAGGIFLRGAMDKLQLEAQTLQWKEYKGAAETFTRDRMSPELHESLEAIVSDCKEVLAVRIAAARSLAPNAPPSFRQRLPWHARGDRGPAHRPRRLF